MVTAKIEVMHGSWVKVHKSQQRRGRDDKVLGDGGGAVAVGGRD